jgi:hypothetical protein
MTSHSASSDVALTSEHVSLSHAQLLAAHKQQHVVVVMQCIYSVLVLVDAIVRCDHWKWVFMRIAVQCRAAK